MVIVQFFAVVFPAFPSIPAAIRIEQTEDLKQNNKSKAKMLPRY